MGGINIDVLNSEILRPLGGLDMGIYERYRSKDGYLLYVQIGGPTSFEVNEPLALRLGYGKIPDTIEV